MYGTVVRYTAEYGEEQGDVLNNELVVAHTEIDAVADIEWMFDEEKDTAAEDFLARSTEDERQRKERGARGCKGGDERGVQEGDC